MPDQLNRSPCTAALSRALAKPPLQVFRESANPPAQDVIRETRRPERANIVLTEATQNGKTVTRFKCVIARVDIINRNGRFYPRSAYQAAIDAAQEDLAAGRLWGLLEHADDWFDPMKGRLHNIAGVYDALSIEGDDVVGEGVVVNTAVGHDLKALFEAKVAVGISTACTGSARHLPAKELDPGYPDGDDRIPVMQDDLRFVTIDFVSDPSNPAGLARAAEQRRRERSPTPSPQEGTMHPKIKALLEKYQGLTLDQIKTEHAGEYLGVLEAIARESAPAPAPTNPAPAPVSPAPAPAASDAEGTLERNVLALNARLEASERQAFTEKRTNIAITALEAAQLPRAPKVGDLDLDARFRSSLIAAAVAAESEIEAKDLVEQMLTERRALMGATQRENHRAAGGGSFNLPAGDNSRTQTEAERRGQPNDASRRVESARSRAGLL